MSATIIKFIFEKLPIINLLNGYKTLIGTLVLWASAICTLLAGAFDLPVITDSEAAKAFLVGAGIQLIGMIHAKAKGQ